MIKNNVKPKRVKTWKGKDKYYHVNIMENQELIYNILVEAWGDQWQEWAKNQPDVKHDVLIDFFMLKGSFKNGKYYNKTWKELGLDIDRLEELGIYKNIGIPKKSP